MSKEIKNVVIFGARGPTGQLTVRMALDAGYNVTVLLPDPDLFPKDLSAAVTVMKGDVIKFANVTAALQGQDAAILAFGNTTEPSYELLMSEGTANVVQNMRDLGIRKVIARLSAFGMTIDHDRMYKTVQESGLDYVAVMPANIVDDQGLTEKYKATDNFVKGMTISRADAAHFFVKLLSITDWDRKTVGVWGDYPKVAYPTPNIMK